METEKKLPIDENPLKKMFGDDPDLFKEILNDFLVQTFKIVQEVKVGHKKHSAEQVEMAAHKLKSSARSVGAFNLGDICSILENAGGEKNWEIIEQNVPLLDIELSNVEHYIKNLKSS